MGSFPEVATSGIVVDSIHGDIHLTDREWGILDTMEFQRLRNLKQLGMGHVTFPNATHTRFAHSLGTLGIMARILETARENAYPLTKRQVENLRMAALLHDIGHYPYSHLMERIDNVRLTEEEVDGPSGHTRTKKSFDASGNPYPTHEELGTAIVTRRPDLVDAIGGKERAREVADLFARTDAAHPQLSKLLHSSFDMDRVDYLKRDSYAAGVPYGNIDHNHLLNSLRISPTGMLGVSEKALPAAEQFLMARFFMHRVVYYHKTTYGMEEACRQLLRRLRDQGLFGIPRDGNAVLDLIRSASLATFTDAFVDKLVSSASRDGKGVIKALARCIESRRPPKLLKEVPVYEDVGVEHHAGTTFKLQAKRLLRALAREHSIPLGQFLLCETKPFRLEERGPRLTAKQARDLAPEQQDEAIKVFLGDELEPTSLVDIPHSLVGTCANRFFQAYRLYVVYQGSDEEKVVGRLREAVKNWHSAK